MKKLNKDEEFYTLVTAILGWEPNYFVFSEISDDNLMKLKHMNFKGRYGCLFSNYAYFENESDAMMYFLRFGGSNE